MHRLLAQHTVVVLARTELLHGKPAGGAPRQRSGQPQAEGRAQRVLGYFPRGHAHFRANSGGAARCEQPGVRGAAWGGARLLLQLRARAESLLVTYRMLAH